MLGIVTKNLVETKKVAAMLAQEFKKQHRGNVRVIALSGNLGAGKTAFVQGFAQALGIKEKVLSPTFVLMKFYALPHNQIDHSSRCHLIHIDCYRLTSARDLLHLGFKKLLQDRDAIIIVEWAERVKKILPKNALWIFFTHGKNPEERVIHFSL